jgi:hypothetical protein
MIVVILISSNNLFKVLLEKIMLKKHIGLVSIGLILNLAFSSFVFAQDSETRATQKIKIRVAEIGTGGKVIEVKFKDKTKIKGYITEIKEDGFVLVSKKNGASTDISYDKVKNIQPILATSRKVGLAVAAGLLTFGIIGTIVSLRSLK